MTEDRDLDESFERTYDARIVRELPGGGATVWHYPGADPKGGKDGMIVRITPAAGESWVGMFAFGYDGGLTRLMTCPDSHWVCVIARGAACLVDSRDPERWREVGTWPVLHTVPAVDAGLLLLGGHTDIEAWNADGFAWRSARLSYDEIEIVGVDGLRLHGKGWEPDVDLDFTLDLSTGGHSGGPGFTGEDNTGGEATGGRIKRLLNGSIDLFRSLIKS